MWYSQYRLTFVRIMEEGEEMNNKCTHSCVLLERRRLYYVRFAWLRSPAVVTPQQGIDYYWRLVGCGGSGGGGCWVWGAIVDVLVVANPDGKDEQ